MGTLHSLAAARAARAEDDLDDQPRDITAQAALRGFEGPVLISRRAARALRWDDLGGLLDLAFWVAAGMRVADADAAPITSRYTLRRLDEATTPATVLPTLLIVDARES